MVVATAIPTALGPNDPDDGAKGREMRGAMIAARSRITKTVKGEYKVRAQSPNSEKAFYLIDMGKNPPTCTCGDFGERAKWCKHIWAVHFTIQRDELDDNEEIPEVSDEVAEKATKRATYPQAWSAYNTAQQSEGDEFPVILRKLVDTVEQPPQETGRPRLLLSDMVFAVAAKVYCTMSTRRSMSNIRRASENGLITKFPSFTSVNRYMEDPALTPVLERLIQRSALPLRDVETHFSPDSSGFTSKSYIRHYDLKWGKEVREVKWVKGHIMSGAKTNIVTVAKVTEEHGNDSPYLEPFLLATVENFNVKEVSADKAYLSKDNLWAIHKVGATPLIPFKENSVRSVANHKLDPVWAERFDHWKGEPDDFDAHYHQRSNVESTFSMIKRKFGGWVRSKTPVAMINEGLSKIVAHNLVTLIHSRYEMGIEPDFSLDEAGPMWGHPRFQSSFFEEAA